MKGGPYQIWRVSESPCREQIGDISKVKHLEWIYSSWTLQIELLNGRDLFDVPTLFQVSWDFYNT